MCIFSGPVLEVGGTTIFARGLPDGRQLLAYAMELSVDDDVAMVLPLPVPSDSAEDAVRFVDLSGYPDLLDHLRESVFPPVQMRGGPVSASGWAASATLEVHRVGSFEASFVPSRGDFTRLDPRFQLSGEVWSALPTYADWGFAVFKLRASSGGDREPIHPMAFEFPRRDPGRLFFPTVHVHDGAVHPTAAFDHVLLLQSQLDDGAAAAPSRFWRRKKASKTPPALTDWLRAPGPGGVDLDRAAGVVAPDTPVYGRLLLGELPNDDVCVDDA